MKQRKSGGRLYGLRRRFACLLGISALACLLLYLVLDLLTEDLVAEYCTRSDYLEAMQEEQIRDLQAYIEERGISSEDLQDLREWERKQPAILFEVYADGRCIYSTVPEAVDEESGEPLDDEFSLQLADREVTAVLYSDFLYHYYFLGKTLCAGAALLVFIVLCLLGSRKMITYIRKLNEEVQILEGGDLEHPVSEEGNDELTDLARSMNRMREAFRQQRETEERLHRLNRQMVTEMSHDLRTPLTGMLLYLEILQSHRCTVQQQEEYLRKIEEKVCLIRDLSDGLFSYTLADDPVRQPSAQGAAETFAEPLLAFRKDLEAQGFAVSAAGNWPDCRVQVNGAYLQRILENIASNIMKYSDPVAPVSVEICEEETLCGFSVTNACAPLTAPAEEAESGAAGGIGLESIRSMMRRMEGQCLIERAEAFFGITLLFPKR